MAIPKNRLISFMAPWLPRDTSARSAKTGGSRVRVFTARQTSTDIDTRADADGRSVYDSGADYCKTPARRGPAGPRVANSEKPQENQLSPRSGRVSPPVFRHIATHARLPSSPDGNILPAAPIAHVRSPASRCHRIFTYDHAAAS
jgi:hypothetical protein